MEPPKITLIKVMYDGKSEKYSVKLKSHRDPTSSTSYLYEFRISLFDNGDPEVSLFFGRKFNMTLVESGMLETDTKFQCLHTLVHGEVLHQFDSFSADVESTETLNVEYIIKGLAFYLPPCKFPFKNKV